MYQVLAKAESDPERSEIFEQLVEAELRHAARWAERLGMDPGDLVVRPSGVKVRLLQVATKLLGARRMLPVLIWTEESEIDEYSADPEAKDLVPEEREHGKTLREMASGSGRLSSRVLGTSGRLRAAVLGVNDGLVSNFSLVMGVAGGTENTEFVLLAGVAGLLAGAFSMSAGEYISMRSQRDIYENEIEKEAVELEQWPEEELEELVLIYRAKGLSEEEARRVAERVMGNPEVALDTMVREELGLDPEELGAPWGAATTSFIAFVAGAAVPIIPYVIRMDGGVVAVSAALSGVALLAVGGLMAVLSSRSVLWGGVRMLLVGGAAATVTYGVGTLIGVTVAG